MEKSKKNNNDIRSQWARERSELFLNTMKKVGEEMGIELTPMQYVQAYKLCVEEYKFGYPVEFKLAELIATEDSYEQTLEIMQAILKSFRIDFSRSQLRRQKAARKRGRRAA